MNLKHIVLLVFFIIVGVEFYRSTQEGQEVPPPHFDLKTESIYSIELEVGLKKIELKKIDTGWWIQSPIKEKADPRVIQEWLSLIVDSEMQVVEPKSKVDWKKFGLDDYMGKVFILSKDNPKVGIYLSSLKSFDQRIYLRVEQEGMPPKLLVASLTWKDLLLKPANAFRDQSLFSGISDIPFNSVDFLEMSIYKSFPDSPKGQYTLQPKSVQADSMQYKSSRKASRRSSRKALNLKERTEGGAVEETDSSKDKALSEETSLIQWVFKVKDQRPKLVDEQKVRDLYTSLLGKKIEGFPPKNLVQKVSKTQPVAKIIFNQMSFLFYFEKLRVSGGLENQFLIHSLKDNRWASLNKEDTLELFKEWLVGQ